MLSAQVNGPQRIRMGMNVPGTDNRQFALNIMHWLSGLKFADHADLAAAASKPTTPARTGKSTGATPAADVSNPPLILADLSPPPRSRPSRNLQSP